MNERERFEQAYRRHSSAVLAYAVRRSDPATATDVAAETFTIAWRRSDLLPDENGQRAWLIGIARRVLSNTRRSERRRLQLTDRLSGEIELHARAALTEHDPRGVDRVAKVAAAIGTLRDDDRELLTLLAWDGLDRDEIAVVLGCSERALRTRIHRARARLRNALEREGQTTDQTCAGSPDLPRGTVIALTTYGTTEELGR